jgi:hypothetical protein
MDDIKQRLQETSQNCFTTFEAWSTDKKSEQLQEDLQNAIHELRKVTSRLEIEVAVNERSKVSQNSMDIPSHRSRGGRGNGNKANNDGGSSKPRQRRKSKSDEGGDSKE